MLYAATLARHIPQPNLRAWGTVRRSTAVSIVWLDEQACADGRLTGGKAAGLSRLGTICRIPPGFCLTTAAFEQALAAGLIPELSAPEPAGAVAFRASALYRTVLAAYQTLSQRMGQAAAATAVRSSGVDEDGADASFAGQHETYLNIVGIEAISAAVVRCWTAATAPRVRAYRRRHGLPLERPRLAVLVQYLIVADVSAVVFSANPLTGSRDEVVISASWGLGESLVGGTVTPDTWTVRKQDLAIMTRLIGDKRRMTVPAGASFGHGTREVDVPRILRTQSALNDGRIAELARLAMDLETTVGRPIDAECAYQDGRLYLLQCRPITTLPRP